MYEQHQKALIIGVVTAMYVTADPTYLSHPLEITKKVSGRWAYMYVNVSVVESVCSQSMPKIELYGICLKFSTTAAFFAR